MNQSATEAIRKAVADRQTAQEKIDELVLQARADGVTWVEIAGALGVSHQAAMQKYRSRT